MYDLDCVIAVTWYKMARLNRIPMCVFACILLCGISGLSVRRVVEDLFKVEPSKLSRFHVLHEWKEARETYVTPTDGGDFPALHTSDVMLQTLGILKGFTWPVVAVGNAFKRPKASVLFLVDGLTEETPLRELSADKTLPVDQSGLLGEFVDDAMIMFGGANDVHIQLDKLFGWDKSLTATVSADVKVARGSDLLDLDYSTTDSGYFISHVDLINSKYCPDFVCIGKDGSFYLANSKKTAFSVQAKEELDLLREVLMSMELPEKIPQAKAHDSYPDVFQFAYSSIQALVTKYGKDSDRVIAAVEGVRSVVEKVTKDLIDKYEGAVVVQALTLVWSRPSSDRVNAIVRRAAAKAELVLLAPANSYRERDFSSIDLEQLTLSSRYKLCSVLKEAALETDPSASFNEELCFGSSHHARSRRGVDSEWAAPGQRHVTVNSDTGDSTSQLSPDEAKGLAFERTENFSAITAIISVVVVVLILVVFGLSWILFTMDPAKDTVVYRLMPGRVKTE